MDYASSPPLLIFDQENSYNLLQLSPCNNNITAIHEEDIPENGRRRKVSGNKNPNEKKKQKVIHRDIERQRRQEMAILYTSLRDLLPYEFLKGKRAISDHIQEAANYIKHMKNKMRKLRNKRENLVVLHDSSNCTNNNGMSCSSPKISPKSSSQKYIMRVESCLDGVVEVSINTAFKDGVPCSTVFDILINEGLDILCSTANKVDDRFIYTIKTKVSEGRSIVPAELHQKLTNLTNN